MKTEFWVAAHLTGLFEINDTSTEILEIGSRGAGISIQRGVTTSIQQSDKSSIIILFDGVQQTLAESLITQKVIKLLIPEEDQKNFQIHHKFHVPIRSGFGTSAAGALGTAFCLNEFFTLELSKLELFQAAHKAEVLTKSGLGDVIGLFQGGLEIRTKEGAPGFGKTIGIRRNNDWKMATVSLGTLSTSSVLSDPVKRVSVNNASSKLIDNLIMNPEFDNFVHSIAEFTRRVQLWSSQLHTMLNNLPEDVIGAQIMLGDALFLFYHEEDELADVNISSDLIQPEEICTETIKRLK
ncbi:MAG: pantoate kinase [Candidatus Hodarchaeales archaeon]|jgi:pantoate kinase